MSLLPLLITISLSLLIGKLTKGRSRSWTLLVISILLMYWLEPPTPIRHLDFWLPTLCLFLTMLTWASTRPDTPGSVRSDLITGLVIAAIVLLISLSRYFDPLCCLTTTRPPVIGQALIAVAAISLIILLTYRFARGKNAWLYFITGLLILIFVFIKSETLTRWLSTSLRTLNGQTVSLASPLDIRWLGFSYVAFRLLHTLRDRMTGKLPGLSLQEFVIYIIFFPAYSAGPIDRVQRFTQDLRQSNEIPTDTILKGGKRILIGIFRKFVLADALAIFALNSTNTSQVNSSGWLWILVYAYALRIYFDFSGYTDMAIGMAELMGIHLPENFDRPYLKQNLTLFWNSWHMTLAQWFRAYFFNPLTRAMRSAPRNIPLPLIIFIGQLSTFVLIGLWHGISWNFAIWGAWHGLGLFIHNRWSDFIRSKLPSLENRPGMKRLLTGTSVFVTFHYVSLGWVWFALSSPLQSINTLSRLFGLI